MFFPILTSSSLQPLKADSIILLTLSGILNFFKELQPLNIPDVILLMSASQTTFSSFSQPPNKPLSIFYIAACKSIKTNVFNTIFYSNVLQVFIIRKCRPIYSVYCFFNSIRSPLSGIWIINQF